MSGSLTRGGGENVPAFPVHAQSAILLRPRQNGCQFTDDMFIFTFLYECLLYFASNSPVIVGKISVQNKLQWRTIGALGIFVQWIVAKLLGFVVWPRKPRKTCLMSNVLNDRDHAIVCFLHMNITFYCPCITTATVVVLVILQPVLNVLIHTNWVE